jgi:hypothetical protein
MEVEHRNGAARRHEMVILRHMNQDSRLRLFASTQALALLAMIGSSCVDDSAAPSCVSDDAAPAPALDGGAAGDAGPSTSGDAATMDAGASDAATSAPEASVATDVGVAPNNQADAGRRLFDGEPACETFGFKLLGAIDGKPVDQQGPSWATSGETQRILTYYGMESDGGVIINMHLTWNQSLLAGQVAPITNGTLRNVVADANATYCVTAGEVGLIPMQPAQAVSYQLTVTAVQPSINGECRGALLPADLKGCLRQSVVF